jgi:RNA recognition motif-containing protein
MFCFVQPKSARVIRDGNRSRGIGLVEFETRENLIDGLKRTDKEVYGRKIRVNVSDKTDSHQTDSGRGTFGNNRSNRSGGGGGEERPEMGDRWKRAERK